MEELRTARPPDGLARHLWEEVHRLSTELEKKERALQELSQRQEALDAERRFLRARLSVFEQAEREAARVAKAAERAAEEAARVADEMAHHRRREAYYRSRRTLRARLSPKLGVLDQYPPRPLHVPSSYRDGPDLRVPPLITLVTPSFGQAHFLERTLESVLGQDYPRLEYVVQDGGSRDGTVAILERYQGRLARCVSAPDRGQAHAVNLGFAGSSGDVMGYLNSDDLLLPGALHAVAATFERHPDVDVVYGHRVVIDEEDGEIGRWVLPPHDDEVLSWADYVPQETLFWRRRVWERVGSGMDESFRFALDWDLLLRLRDAGARFLRVPRFLGCFRVHPTQKTSARMEDLGLLEMARLRERCHGRNVTEEEIRRHTRPYLWRHLVVHKLYRLGAVRY
jgi:glycosyltransferase involved in cell wall biosynthesis